MTGNIADFADRFELVQLTHQMCLTSDRADVEGWVGCFTPEGLWQYYGPDGRLGREARGAEALRVQAKESAQKYHNFELKHHCVNPVAEVDGDTAVVHSYYFTILRNAENKLLVRTSGRYRDECIKGDDGAWRIQSREVRLDVSAG